MSTIFTPPRKPMAPVWWVPQEEGHPEIWIWGRAPSGIPGFPYCMDAGGKESLGVADAHLADAGSDAAYGCFK